MGGDGGRTGVKTPLLSPQRPESGRGERAGRRKEEPRGPSRRESSRCWAGLEGQAAFLPPSPVPGGICHSRRAGWGDARRVKPRSVLCLSERPNIGPKGTWGRPVAAPGGGRSAGGACVGEKSSGGRRGAGRAAWRAPLDGTRGAVHARVPAPRGRQPPAPGHAQPRPGSGSPRARPGAPLCGLPPSPRVPGPAVPGPTLRAAPRFPAAAPAAAPSVRPSVVRAPHLGGAGAARAPRRRSGPGSRTPARRSTPGGRGAARGPQSPRRRRRRAGRGPGCGGCPRPAAASGAAGSRRSACSGTQGDEARHRRGAARPPARPRARALALALTAGPPRPAQPSCGSAPG